MAALDRQHPRDLFDVYYLLSNEGISDDLRSAIIVYLISHDHSPHSLLKPVLKDISHEYVQNFSGMTSGNVEVEMLLATRAQLIAEVVGKMPEHHKAFLKSFYSRKPDWALLGLDGVEHLPAVKWRELNLDRAGAGTKEEIIRRLLKVIQS